MYIVVYELSQESGFCYGLRYLVEYNDEKDAADHPQKNTTIIARGISLQEASDLTALTPEICVFASCLEEHEHITIDQIYLVEIPARTAVCLSRKIINTNLLTRIDASPYIAHLRELSKNETMQAACLKGFLARLANEYTGEVMTW